MESRISAQKRGVLQKIPDIKSALGVLEYLSQKKGEDSDKPIQTRFKLADCIHMDAELVEPRTVMLWLGAKVMVEFEYEEATQLLQKNLKSAEVNLSNLNEDLSFLKDQITTSEVNLARLHNYSVALKKKQAPSSAKVQ